MSEADPKPESKREKATRERRAKIVEAAMTCFLESGYHQTGVRDIAKRAGVSLGNLYNHFPGKHDVLAEIASLERAESEPFLKLLASPSPAPKLLDKFISAYGRYLAQPENIFLAIEITSEAIRKPDIGNLFLANREILVTHLARVIERGIAEGALRTRLDPPEAALLIIDMIDSGAYRAVLEDISMRKVLRSMKVFINAALGIEK